ncbi:6-phosphogluconate dehydrogenase [Aureibaculum marinum]|uniref:6-phosphogluconate dehydrogenase n=1 Tax=Aureibaculum marinum TaxID=2487930 RepID=A0A3N4NJC2_9FLAO|nr:6-phosphogluconate dehydrogenase [Aureibaculum marinum]RPD96502.1 6-phosphogluconate dehydrogenase [Aureibaculum marinum]
MKKIVGIIVAVASVLLIGYFLIVYYATFSNGYRSGELIKITHKGLIFKTWEGEISQGVSESQHFSFSVESSEKEVIQQLKDFQGMQVKLTYKERFATFPWLGDTKYFVTEVKATTKE